MDNKFKSIEPEKITGNTFKLIGTDWMLITAGTTDHYNTMTASWGGLGILWNKKVCFCVIRPSRYTYQFMEQTDKFTLSFFDDKYRDVLKFCGSRSGRDVDKVNATGITPIEGTTGAVYFAEAKLVMECKKLYFQDLNPDNFLEADIEKNYNHKDYHRMYIGEIIKCYSNI